MRRNRDIEGISFRLIMVSGNAVNHRAVCKQFPRILLADVHFWKNEFSPAFYSVSGDDNLLWIYPRAHVLDKPLLDQQAIHFHLAGLQTEVEALRALTYGAVEDYINGMEVTLKASMAKLKGGSLVREVTDACMQYWGGMGFMWDNPVSCVYHDQRLSCKKTGTLPRG